MKKQKKKAATKGKKKVTKKTTKKSTKVSKVTTKKSTKKASTPKASTKKAASRSTAVKGKATTKKSAETLIERQLSKVVLGATVPNIVLSGTAGITFDLSQHRGKIIVLYFYPKDNTPGCTQEGHDFTALYDKFRAANAEVFGISRDSVKSHEGFKAKQKYSFELLSDADEATCRLLGVMQPKTLYGRKFLGVERSTFVINEKGELVKEWRKVSVGGHAEEVLEFVSGL